MNDSVIKGIIRALLQCPDPMRRLFFDALRREAPELIDEIDQVRSRSVPYLQLGEARRTTMTGEKFTGWRFSAVVITAETDEGDYVAWPNFQIGNLPLHDLQMLELSLSEWLPIIQRKIRNYGKPVGGGPIREAPPPKPKREEDLPDVDLSDYE